VFRHGIHGQNEATRSTVRIMRVELYHGDEQAECDGGHHHSVPHAHRIERLSPGLSARRVYPTGFKRARIDLDKRRQPSRRHRIYPDQVSADTDFTGPRPRLMPMYSE